MSDAPIGVIDSGLGGLTAVRRLHAELPGENLIYFGDTARLPYGNRDRETLRAFARSDIALLRGYGVKAVLVACGTISSTVLEELREEYDFPLVGVIEGAADTAARVTKNGKVGVWGTAASIAGGAYARRLETQGVTSISAVPCPKLVPLIEAGKTAPGDPEVHAAVAEYLEPVLAHGADTLILGCTHYPLLEEAIRAQCGDRLLLIDSGGESVARLRAALAEKGLLRAGGAGVTRYLVSGSTAEFSRHAGDFLRCALDGKVERTHAG